jgi:hypothetical protein
VEQVFAGFIVGFALSIVVAPLGAIALVRSGASSAAVASNEEPPRPRTSVTIIALGIHLLSVFALTAVGMILGLALAGIEDRRPEGGLGSPNLAYTALVVALTAAVVIPTLLLPWRRPALVIGLLFVFGFGWVVPWLAEAA